MTLENQHTELITLGVLVQNEGMTARKLGAQLETEGAEDLPGAERKGHEAGSSR